MGGIIASAILGIDTNSNTTYQAFTLLSALLAVSFIFSFFFRARLRIYRTLSKFGAAGSPMHYRIKFLNIGEKALRGLTVAEKPHDPRPLFKEFRERRGITWGQHVHRNRLYEPEKNGLPDLLPCTETEIDARLTPLRRGRLYFEAMEIFQPDPLGLVNAYATAPSRQSILILPRRYLLPDIKLPGTRAYQHGGIALSTSVADSEEFQSLREYRPGDPLRLIHWKSLAKATRPIIKEFQDEYFVRHALVLDTFIDRDEHGLFEEAVSVAASFACTIQTQESLLDLMFVGAEVYCETIGRSQGQTEHLLEILACVRPCMDKPFSTLHHLAVSRRPSMSGCVCVFLSWDKSRRDFIEHLNRIGVSTMVVVIADPLYSNIQIAEDREKRPSWLHIMECGKIEEGLAAL